MGAGGQDRYAAAATAQAKGGLDAGDDRVLPSPHHERLRQMIIERIDLMIAIRVPSKELAAQVSHVVEELLQEEHLSLSATEQDQLVDDFVSRVRRAADRLGIDGMKGAEAGA